MEVTKILYMLMVSDMSKSVGFYRDVIGLDVQVQSPGWSELTLGNATVALHISRNAGNRATGLNFEVSNIEDACNELDAAGGSVIQAPYGGGVPGLLLADVEDPDGNGFQFSHHAHSQSNSTARGK